VTSFQNLVVFVVLVAVVVFLMLWGFNVIDVVRT
jgi:hypothetical protein